MLLPREIRKGEKTRLWGESEPKLPGLGTVKANQQLLQSDFWLPQQLVTKQNIAVLL